MTMPTDTQLHYFCDPAWHDGEKIGADYLVSGWISEADHLRHTDEDRASWCSCEAHLPDAIAAIEVRAGYDRMYFTLMTVTGR